MTGGKTWKLWNHATPWSHRGKEKRWNSGPAVFLLLVFLISISSFLVFPEPFLESHAEQVLLPPSSQHWLGTDSLGRDYLARLMIGMRVSILVAFGSSVISLVVGAFIGSYLVYIPGWNRFLLSRSVDILQGLPSFMIIAILMQATGQHSLINLAILMGLFHWPGIARLTQAEVMKVQAEPYVEASTALGASRLYVLRKHVWPACYPIWSAWFVYHLPAEIMFESSLSFLGFGAQAPQVSLGVLIQEAWSYLSLKPLFLMAPATLVFLLVYASYRLKKNDLDDITH